jgi:RNA polymerase sigma-70 factor (ECF subfamily)
VDVEQEADGAPEPRPTFEVLLARHELALHRYARRLCRGNADPAELVQETRIKAFLRYGELRDHRSAWAWLKKLAFTLFVDGCRRRRRSPSEVPLEEAEAVPANRDPPLASEQISMEEYQACIARLPEKLREVYRMRAIEGRKYKSIAAALGIPEGTVARRLSDAKKQLKELLAQGDRS